MPTLVRQKSNRLSGGEACGLTAAERRRTRLAKNSEDRMSKIGFCWPRHHGQAHGGKLDQGWSRHVPLQPLGRVEGSRGCWGANGKEVAEQSEIIITMVLDTPHVQSALFDDGGIGQGLSPGKIVVDMSSISPIEIKSFAKRINDLGCRYLDAPVSGGEVGAKNATLSIMVGGPEEAFDRVKPIFELMGKNITRVGENGDGQTAKVANQIIVALTIEAVGEALLFAAKAGADPAKVREALMGGFASSKILEVHGERMVKRTFDPGFRIELHQKDLNLALSRARQWTVAAEHSAGAGAVQRLRGPWWQRLGSLRHGPRAGDDGEFRDRAEDLTSRLRSRR
jgi:2-hydroxy-3-oxopropionate reductase